MVQDDGPYLHGAVCGQYYALGNLESGNDDTAQYSEYTCWPLIAGEIQKLVIQTYHPK